MAQHIDLHTKPKMVKLSLPISSAGANRASAPETVDSGLICDQVKPKTTKIGIYSSAA